MVIKCKTCHKPLGELNLSFVVTTYWGDLIEGGRKAFCNERCYSKYLDKYFVENYNGHKIYWIFKNNMKYYIPYAGCSYGFKTLQDCKNRIDANNISICM